MPSPFDADRPYRLNPCVALRPEPFGALAYHFGNRRLSFLKAPELVELVRELGRHASAREALAGVPEARRDTFRRALASLAAADMIIPTGAEPQP
ncbi:mycofactocin biosynthesis chaperone MftB [Streptomyces sp. HUAS TT20]|uniref:mycofactocin biosynthesis chaperone MftB n=1 Tax=Streptomyces sp. HUAS TT20 TaxID=3447509 RepID=UPI0021DAE5C7|nr:mycofactocin biosynthesis chaperone MftB [Streptomyces sp. HUAS 15-9]UXY28716.1 mycofactocin biosynthesis chaperone MftB [Streptomyces sp. HUAS 15-9]